MNNCSLNKYTKIIQKGNNFTLKEINNTIDQCEKFLNIIHDYLKKCLQNLVRISIPTLDLHSYITACNEIRLYIREIDNIVQSAQYNTRQILVSTKNTESSKEIVFNILPFGYTFIFHVPVVDSVALGLDSYKIDWNYKHACINALVATLPKNINRTDEISLLQTYNFENQLIGGGHVYSNYGIDKGNVTSAILKLSKDFNFNDYNFIQFIPLKWSDTGLYDNNTCPSALVTCPDNTILCPDNIKYVDDDVFSEILISHNSLYLTYISQKTQGQVDFCSKDLLTYTFPFETGTSDKEREDFINLNLHKFKNHFNKALNLIELEMEKMIHYKCILMPMQQKVLNIHYDGNLQYVKNKCDSNHLPVNRYTRNHVNKKVYPTRSITEFEPSYFNFYSINKGNLITSTNPVVDNNYGFNIELLTSENRKQTYNKNNIIELFTANNVSFAKYEYKSQVFGSVTFELI